MALTRGKLFEEAEDACRKPTNTQHNGRHTVRYFDWELTEHSTGFDAKSAREWTNAKR